MLGKIHTFLWTKIYSTAFCFNLFERNGFCRSDVLEVFRKIKQRLHVSEFVSLLKLIGTVGILF